MEYKIRSRDNYDRSLKIQNIQILLYSEKMFKKVAPDAKIAGEVVISKNKKQDEESNTLKLGSKTFTVSEPGKTNTLIYKTKGYVAVGDNEYIRIFQSRLPFILIILLFMLVTIISIIIIMNIPVKPAEVPTNPLPQLDPNIVVDDTPDKTPVDIPEGGGSADISYRPTAVLTLSTGGIEMGYTNPATSSHDAVIRLYAVSRDANGHEDEYLIAESGLIPRGNKLGVMTLLDDMQGLFSQEGSYRAKYRISFYDHQTGEKAVVDSEMTDIILKVRS